MIAKLPTSRAQILRTSNHLLTTNIFTLTWQISAVGLSSTNKVLKLSLEIMTT
jgi:hypothetical protein